MSKSYLDELRDPRWKALSERIKKIDEYACTSCGDKPKRLEVHHKTYKWGKKPWEYEDDNLVTLCEPCHERVTRMNNALKAAIVAILDANIDAVSCGLFLTGIQNAPDFISIDRALFITAHLLLDPHYARVCSVILDEITNLRFDAELRASSLPNAVTS